MENNYDQINKNNGNICPSFEELLSNIQTIYSRLTKNERNSSHYICQKLKQEYYNNSNYLGNYSQTTSIEDLQNKLKNLETELAELQKANQDEIDKNNSKLSSTQNNGIGGKNNSEGKIRVSKKWWE